MKLTTHKRTRCIAIAGACLAVALMHDWLMPFESETIETGHTIIAFCAWAGVIVFGALAILPRDRGWWSSCPKCGYNLRGLRPGASCPECASPPVTDAE